MQFNQSPAGQAIDAARRKTQELQDESKQFQADLQTAGKVTPELILRAAELIAKGKSIVAEIKATQAERTKLARAQRAAQKAEVEKILAALKDDPGPRG